MRAAAGLIARTIRWFLIVFGSATCMPLLFAIDLDLLTPNNAAECLRRAEAMLDGRHEQAVRTPATATRQGLAPWQVRRVLTYIEANLERSIKNKDLAAVARLSVFHFNVAFRNSVGDSPHEHVIRRRMERAQGLMLSTEMSLSEIAGECGLADQAHLTRLFHRVVGASPACGRLL